MAVDDHVTTLPEAGDRGAPEAAGNIAGLRARRRLSDPAGADLGSRRRAHRYAAYSELVSGRGDDVRLRVRRRVRRRVQRHDPDPYLEIGAARLRWIFPRRRDRHSPGNDDRAHQDPAPITGSDDLAAAPDPGNGMVAAVDDLFWPRTECGDLPGVPRRVLSDPAEHDIWRALGRSAIVRGGFHAGLFRHGNVSRNHPSRVAAGHLQRTADCAWFRLDPHRGR